MDQSTNAVQSLNMCSTYQILQMVVEMNKSPIVRSQLGYKSYESNNHNARKAKLFAAVNLQ